MLKNQRVHDFTSSMNEMSYLEESVAPKHGSVLNFQEFYDKLVEEDYLSLRIDYEWRRQNEDYMRQVLFNFYSMYSKIDDPMLTQSFLKLYSEVMLDTYDKYPLEGGYL